MQESIKIAAPATISNVGPGFDILGFSTELISDVIELRIRKGERNIIIENKGRRWATPTNPIENTAGIAVFEFLNFVKANFDVIIRIEKKIGIGTGLGSSAASAAAVVFGLNEMLKTKLDENELIKIAIKGEKASAGAEHADNIAPSLLGGFTLIKGYSPLEIVKIENHLNFFVLILLPDIVINTSKARKILKKTIPMNKVIEQSGNLASLIYAISKGELELFFNSFKDSIIVPQRKKLIPFYDELQEHAFNKGARAFGMSGAGPATIALTESKELAKTIGTELKLFLKTKNISANIFVTKLSLSGTHLIK